LGTRGITQTGQREVSVMLRDSWLYALIPPKRMPQVVDARTGEPILLVEDHFRVSDWGHLEKVLAAQPEVEGDRASGWRRMEFREGQRPRSGWNLRVGPQDDTLIGFARTAKAADDNRAWLESVAGDSVRFLLRDSMAPMSPAAQEASRRRKPEPDFLQTLLREERNRLMQQLHEQIYERWADEPIPLLGGKTPRELVETADGRERVGRLLKDYEAGEARRARAEDREPVDFGFLWARVGLSREDANIR
jgi:hypothetical protein